LNIDAENIQLFLFYGDNKNLQTKKADNNLLIVVDSKDMLFKKQII